MSKATKWLLGTSFLATLGAAAAAPGALISFPYNFEFSGATPPAGAAPWLTATFDDGGGSGSVDLTFTATNLIAQEFVFETSFNLDPALNPTSLVFSAPVKTGSFADPVVSKGVDAFQADGDGKYDIQIAFANGGGAANRFGPGEAVKYTITGIPTLTASSFNFLSAPAGGNGPFHVAAHVGGIGASGNDSGWVTFVPEPGTLAAAALAASALFVRRRRAI